MSEWDMIVEVAGYGPLLFTVILVLLTSSLAAVGVLMGLAFVAQWLWESVTGRGGRGMIKAKQVTERDLRECGAVCVLAACMVFSGCFITRGLSGNANNSSVRCDCRCHRCDDGDSGGAVLDSRANTGEARR